MPLMLTWLFSAVGEQPFEVRPSEELVRSIDGGLVVTRQNSGNSLTPPRRTVMGLLLVWWDA